MGVFNVCVEEVERPGYYDVFQEEGAIDIVRGAIPINQANSANMLKFTPA